MNNIKIDFKSWFYKNCKRQRKVGAKICQVCPSEHTLKSKKISIKQN